MEDQSSEKDDRGSSVSRSSSKSSMASAAARARATAEAARTRVAFAQKELELKKQRAKLDLEKATLEADLEALELEKAAAVANAEAEVLEAAAGRACEDVQSARSSISPETIRQQTEAYLQHQAQEDFDPTTSPPDTSLPFHIKVPSPSVKQEAAELNPAYNHNVSPTMPRRTQRTEYLSASGHQRHLPEHPISHPLSCNVINQGQDSSSFKHVSHPAHFPKNNTHDSVITPAANMIDFAKYLARRELVTTGLSKFDDRPESFRAWQSSFFNATQGLELTASEELDLLVKWLGKESSEHIKRLRAVYVTNPQAALQLSWTRLQECYATPEVIENALFKRLDSFPRLTSKENIKLRELSDLLMELLSAKEDGYLPGLSYLDTPRGIKPIVEKLPPNLQEKWLSAGSSYKERHSVCFPPFSFFADFVHRQAKARNDPSFVLTENSRTHYHSERPITRQDGMKAAISVHKTDVSTTAESSSMHGAHTTKNGSYDAAKYCPLHNKSHPLEKCRAFKMEPLAERKRLLREHRRCFRCCSTTHMARECTVELKCNECESNRHITAMHPETTFSPVMSPTAESDIKQRSSDPPEVTSKCTEVCGEGLHSRSCAKISLVRVFPQGQREHSVKMYAIIDDQSNRSLARSEFFQLFGIQGGLSPYLMRTCAGTTEMVGRKAVGFQVEAMNGELCFDLPPLIECNEIMSNRSEIPTPEVAPFHAHLKSVAPHIPQLDSEAQILMLLGRDLIRVHKVRQQINGPHDAPFAQRLDLGWVIVGEACIESVHKPTVAVFKTNVLQNGRPSFLTPCQNHIRVKEKPSYGGEQSLPAEDKLGSGVFINTENDNKPALSFEDETFLKTTQEEFHRDEQNSWVAPLPFRSPRACLPNNRVHRIRQTTSPKQWHHVPTDQNPADLATRSVPASQLIDTMWFTGPDFLHKPLPPDTDESFEMVDPETDVDVRPQLTTLATHISEGKLTTERFQRFSTWDSLLRAVSFLIHQTRSHKSDLTDAYKKWHQCNKPRTQEELAKAKLVILKSVQREAYPEEYVALQENRAVSRSSAILDLDPFMCDGLLRIRGRLRHAPIDSEVRNPIILPKQSHVTKLLVSHYHTKVAHQGRQFTEGAVRAAGLWIVAGKRLISSVLHHCVTCRKLRGKLEVQKMADLPPERLNSSPPFTYVGLDVFGPWNVVTRRTRGGAAQSKRWAILFTCMSTRAVHVEVIESMDSSSCINALRRFFAVRGPAKQLRSDRGTNFVGASFELGMGREVPSQTNVLKYLQENGCTWEFNPPHASHMGGVWERMIGVTRRILDYLLLQTKRTSLTHEVLCTLMAEVSAIINARPLVPVSSDPSSPVLLTPAMLLTQKPGLTAPAGSFEEKDLFKCQWRQVQALANEFWTRWRNEYLHTLQPRRKWNTASRNLQVGDIVLMKQSQSPRNEWPMGLVTSTLPSSDGKVRKIEVRTTSQGKVKTFLRPISDVVLLLTKDSQESSKDN